MSNRSMRAHLPCMTLLVLCILAPVFATDPEVHPELEVLQPNQRVVYTLGHFDERLFVVTVPGGTTSSLNLLPLNPDGTALYVLCAYSYLTRVRLQCKETRRPEVSLILSPLSTKSYVIEVTEAWADPYPLVRLVNVADFIKPNGVGIYSPTVAEQSKIGIFVPAGTEAQVVMDTLNPESGADPHICLVNMAGETIACDDQPATAVRSVVKFLANVTDFYRVIVSSKAGNPEVQVYMNYTGATPAVDADTGTFYNASGYQNSMFFMPGLVRATVTVTTSTSDANAVAVSMNQYDNDNLWPQPLHPSSNVSVAIGNDTVTKTFIVSAMPGARFDVTTYRDPTLSVVHASVTLRDVAWATIDWMDQAQFYLRNREKGYAKLARTTYDRHVQLYTYMNTTMADMTACLVDLDDPTGMPQCGNVSLTTPSLVVSSTTKSKNWLAYVYSQNTSAVRITAWYTTSDPPADVPISDTTDWLLIGCLIGAGVVAVVVLIVAFIKCKCLHEGEFQRLPEGGASAQGSLNGNGDGVVPYEMASWGKAGGQRAPAAAPQYQPPRFNPVAGSGSPY